MSSGPELTTVESPFIGQLIGMGWKLVTGSLDAPSVSDDARISQAVSALERIAAP